MKEITKDILTIDRGIIVHQVNCQGVMGAGLAKAIGKRWPKVKAAYLNKVAQSRQYNEPLLGDAFLVYADKGKSTDLIIANLFGQDRYGRDRCCTDYNALETALCSLDDWNTGQAYKLPIYLPYGLGCGLAGGDWEIVRSLIEDTCPDSTICKLPERAIAQ